MAPHCPAGPLTLPHSACRFRVAQRHHQEQSMGIQTTSARRADFMATLAAQDRRWLYRRARAPGWGTRSTRISSSCAPPKDIVAQPHMAPPEGALPNGRSRTFPSSSTKPHSLSRMHTGPGQRTVPVLKLLAMRKRLSDDQPLSRLVDVTMAEVVTACARSTAPSHHPAAAWTIRPTCWT